MPELTQWGWSIKRLKQQESRPHEPNHRYTDITSYVEAGGVAPLSARCPKQIVCFQSSVNAGRASPVIIFWGIYRRRPSSWNPTTTPSFRLGSKFRIRRGLGRVVERGPNPNRTVVAPRGEHERIRHRVPGHARQVSTDNLCPDVVQQCSRFTIPDVNVAGCVWDVNVYVSKDPIAQFFQQKGDPTFSGTHNQFSIPPTKVRRTGEIYGSLRHVRVS